MAPARVRDIALCGLAAGLMFAFALLQVAALDVPWLRRLELAALDAQIQFRGPFVPGPETVIVMIDDRTLSELGGWPVSREKMAEAVRALHRAGGKVIGLDVLFADPSRGTPTRAGSPDTALASAIADAGNVVLPFTFRFGSGSSHADQAMPRGTAYTTLRKSPAYRPLGLEASGVVTPLASVARAATLGHMLIAFDLDGAPRYEYPAFEFDLDYYPSMAVRVVQQYLGVPWNDVVADLGRGIALGAVAIPTDPQMRLLVNYPGPAGTFPTIPLWQVLAGMVPEATFRDRIVLIGADALGTRDTFQSPFTAVMPGVERLAAVIDAILHDRHLQRPPLASWVEAGVMLLAALALGLAVSRLTLPVAAVCALALLLSFFAASQLALARWGLWFAAAVPSLALALTFVALSLYRYGLLDRERRHLRHAFSRYLAPAMVDRLVSRQKLPELGGELRELTVLFCDLRGFTSISEALEPARLTRLVNGFFELATEAIQAQGGTVDKYVGDAVMAFWNAPLDQRDHALRACRAALSIVQRVALLNRSQDRAPGTPELRVGIGINTGPCTVGNFGSKRRFDYSAIGDPVNVAARLEGETKTFATPVLLGPETARSVSRLATLPVGPVRLRGREEAMEVYALLGDENIAESAAFGQLVALHDGLRDAIEARDAAAMLRQLEAIKTHAPLELVPLYEALLKRAGAGGPA